MENLTYSLIEKGEGVYFVEEGDTLDAIAEKFKTTKELIIKDNFLSGEVITGDCLYIKVYKNVYIVKVDDTPNSVAKSLGVSVDEMFKINKINYVYPFMKVVS